MDEVALSGDRDGDSLTKLKRKRAITYTLEWDSADAKSDKSLRSLNTRAFRDSNPILVRPNLNMSDPSLSRRNGFGEGFGDFGLGVGVAVAIAAAGESVCK